MRFKFCGMTRQEDLDAAASLGASMCGFIFHRASPRFITPEKAASLNSGKMLRVGVFVDANFEYLAACARAARLDLLQLHGGQSLGLAHKLGSERIIKVFWPEACGLERLQAELEAWRGSCAYVLLDAGANGGGSGRCLDWNVPARLRFPAPWLLAGGLGPSNLKNALEQCDPFGVDLNSGVETSPGVKNHALMEKVAKLVLTPTKRR